MFEVDHVIVCADLGAPEAERLITFGLTEGGRNAHPGQGTVNRRFFFRNLYLELLWVANPEECQSELVRPTQLWPRWSQRRSGASLFGLCLRSTSPEFGGVPFPGWEYKPPYWPFPLGIHVRDGVPVSEPWWVYLGYCRRSDDPSRAPRQPLEHRAGVREVTHLRLTVPGSDGPRAGIIAGLRGVVLDPGPEHLLELTFDNNTHGRRNDFRPDLPLLFRW
jgi:hypothetical protein